MWATASSRADRWLFPAWVIFAAINVVLMFTLPGKETIPFHFVWISLSLVYGVQTWQPGKTFAVLAAVCVLTGAALVGHVRNGVIGWEETTEVPLMTMVFLAMVWHVRRRAIAVNDACRLAESEHRIRNAQRRFVRFASHELRTPVTVARGYTELIRAEAELPQVMEDAEIVLDELDKLEKISARLLTLASMDERSTLHPTPVDLDLLLQQTIKRWRPLASRRWSLQTDARIVMADAARLGTAIDSLLENSVRYTEDDGCISICACREGRNVVIQVRDDGSGIPADEIGFVFESFRSGANMGGTGMGLAIVKAVVEAHGGSVRADSPPHAGTTFTLTLPVNGPVIPGGSRLVAVSDEAG